MEAFSLEQTGKAGDMTASRRVKVPLVPVENMRRTDGKEPKSAFHWANCLHLEWFSEQNGRVVIEGVGFDVEIADGPIWSMTCGDLKAQADASSHNIVEFLAKAAASLEVHSALQDDEEAIPAAEAEMDAEMERMDTLTDRIARRLEKEGLSDVTDWERIYEEESARLRKQRGEPEPEPLTPEQEEERRQWVEEMNSGAAEALKDMEAEAWKGGKLFEKHPLVEECRQLSRQLYSEKFVPADTHPEHPLSEIRDSLSMACGKLAGALNRSSRDEEWPPDQFTAPSVLVFLKKARDRLRDALAAMDSADEQNLVTARWRLQNRRRISHILAETQRHIDEARRVLRDDWDDW